MRDGNRMSTRVAVPLREMALETLETLFPFLTPDQCDAIRGGRQVPGPAAAAAAAGESRREAILCRRMIEAGARGVAGVTAVLVVSDHRRVGWARRAVNQFVRQSYPNKELVVVNATGTPVTTSASPRIVEITADPGQTPDAMRGLGAAVGSNPLLVPCWDDDDLYDPHYLAFLVSHYRYGVPVLLTSQVRVDITTSAVTEVTDPAGLHDTLLVPRVAVAFDDAGLSYGVARGVEPVDTSGWPFNCLKIRVYTGTNVTPRDEFMRGVAPGQWTVSRATADHVRREFEALGFAVTPAVA